MCQVASRSPGRPRLPLLPHLDTHQFCWQSSHSSPFSRVVRSHRGNFWHLPDNSLYFERGEPCHMYHNAHATTHTERILFFGMDVAHTFISSQRKCKDIFSFILLYCCDHPVRCTTPSHCSVTYLAPRFSSAARAREINPTFTVTVLRNGQEASGQ